MNGNTRFSGVRVCGRAERAEARKESAIKNLRLRFESRASITASDKDQLLHLQRFCCAVCGRHDRELPAKMRPVVKPGGGVIGMVCGECRSVILRAGFDSALLRSAADLIDKASEVLSEQ